MNSKKEFTVTQQWDYFTKDWPELKNEDFMKYCADHGVTSLQSYVYWASVEKVRGHFSFDFYDDIVGRMTKYGLKWVPFIIAGPDYATPQWFHESSECVYAKCLEHEEESRVQSIWNPYIMKYVDILMREIAAHFSSDVIESVLVGMSGNWGESIYPVGGGFNFKNRPFHTHLGWWCGDDYAKADFKEIMSSKCGDTNLPTRREIKMQRCVSRLLSILYEHCDGFFGNSTQKAYLKYLSRKEKGKYLQKMSNFADWYISSMNKYVDRWLSVTRKHFPYNKIYVVTGGDGNPMTGVDFAEQTKIAKKYDGGVRITNQSDNVAECFALTRWLTTAAKHYGSYFTTEEALYNSHEGIKVRLADAAINGASGAYFKTILDCTLTGDCELKIKGKGEGGNVLKDNLKLLERNYPTTDIALLLPTTSIRSVPFFIKHIYKKAMKLKQHIDMDFLCEDMIMDRHLDKYKELLIFHSAIIRPETQESVTKWKKRGGKIVADRSVKLYGF